MSDPTTKDELLTAMDQGYTTFEILLAPLSEIQLTTPGVNGAWSIKDILAHLAAWQGRVAERFEAILANDEAYQPDPAVNTDEEMNQFNAETFRVNSDRPLGEVWLEFRATYQRIHTGIEALSNDDLFDPQRFAWTDGSPLWENVAGNTFGHYEEHIPMIEAWLSR
jgi:hypothetical protein